MNLSSKAQEIILSTQAAARKVGTDDPFEVRYSIKNTTRIQDVELPSSKDFQVLGGPSQSTNMSIINGHRTVSIEYTYVLRAKHTGTATIPGIVATIDGREYRSNPVPIEVVAGSVVERGRLQRQSNPFGGMNPFDDPFFTQDPFGGDDPFAAIQKQHQQLLQMLQRRGQQQQIQPRSNSPQIAPEVISKSELADNLFIRADVDKYKATVGEQITASYKLYTRLPMEINLTKLPSLIGFWSQDFNLPQPPKPKREIHNGKEYQVFEIKRTALFPTQSGTLELDPAEATGIARLLKPKQVRQQQRYSDEDEFLQGLFGSMMMNDPSFRQEYMDGYDYEDVQVTLKSKPIQIHVNDVPTVNKPPSYKGAVGTYNIESTIDKTELTTDDNATITIRVSGTGNLKLIGTPDVNLPDELEAFDPTINDTITNTNNIIAGYKSFVYSIAPKTAGRFNIPPTTFSYFDPETQSFKTLSTPSYTLHVKPGNSTSSSNALPKDIHDIHSSPSSISQWKVPSLPTSPLYWSGYVLPVLAYLGLAFYRRKEENLLSNTTLYKNKQANKIALKRLVTAEKYLQLQNQSAFFEETSKAVWLYISDKLSIPLSELSKDTAKKVLKSSSVDDTTISELERIITECEMALYTPDHGTMKMHQTYSDAIKLLGKLEEQIIIS